MALTVETGSGGDCYDTLANFKTWAIDRKRNYTNYPDTLIEAKLRLGFDWINTKQRYKGSIAANSAQVGAFPRDGLTDWDGRTVTGVPQRVKWANFELAWAQLIGGEELYQNLDRGGRIASKTIGPISTSYFADAPAGKVWTAAMKMLEPYARSTQDSFAPFIGGTAGQASTEDAATELTPIFSVGMHTNSDT